MQVFLRHDEVNSEADAWRVAAVAQAVRLCHADAYRRSHLGVVRAAALQVIGSRGGGWVQGETSRPPADARHDLVLPVQ